jgi:hypothetical protein
MLVVIPPTTLSGDLNQLLATFGMPTLAKVIEQPRKVQTLNTKDELLRDVFVRIPANMDLPSVSKYYEINRSSNSGGNALITLNDGSPFVYASGYGRGRILLFTSALSEGWSTLPRHSLFVPLMVKAAFGTKKNYTLYYRIGSDPWVSINNGAERQDEKMVHIKGAGTDMVAEVSLRNGRQVVYLGNEAREAGICRILSAGQENLISSFALNYPRTESDVAVASTAELEEVFGKAGVQVVEADANVIGKTIQQQLNGTPLWRIALLLALVFLLFEILLLKLLK